MIMSMNEYAFGNRLISDYDIFDDKYLVIYFGQENKIEVWEIFVNIYLYFKMVLP